MRIVATFIGVGRSKRGMSIYATDIAMVNNMDMCKRADMDNREVASGFPPTVIRDPFIHAQGIWIDTSVLIALIRVIGTMSRSTRLGKSTKRVLFCLMQYQFLKIDCPYWKDKS